MKLLDEIARLYTAGVHGVAVRGSTAAQEPRVVTQASLPAAVAVGAATCTAAERAVVPTMHPRSEPASFLKSPRHLRRVTGR